MPGLLPLSTILHYEEEKNYFFRGELEVFELVFELLGVVLLLCGMGFTNFSPCLSFRESSSSA